MELLGRGVENKFCKKGLECLEEFELDLAGKGKSLEIEKQSGTW